MFELLSSTDTLNALYGGTLIGIACILLFAFNGRISGICGMAFSLMATRFQNNIWRILFLVAMIIGTLIFHKISGTAYPQAPNTALPWLILGGILVGFGTSLGNGCTSGHGISGIARLSPRSMVATVTFMGSAILCFYLVKHLLGADI